MRVKSLLCVFFLLLMAGGVFAQVQTGSAYPKREFRAAWIQSVNGQFRGMPTEKLKQNLIGQLNSLQKAGINAIIFQVRPEADALYASRLEPWSRFLTGVQGKAPEPYWDPMQFMIDECHKRGMEFHAWINPYRTKTTLKSELAPNHVYNIHNRAGPTRGIAHAPTVRSQAHETLKTMTTVIMRTSEGDITIDLFDDKAPNTVANFLGLATGEKEWADPYTGQPSHGKFYAKFFPVQRK